MKQKRRRQLEKKRDPGIAARPEPEEKKSVAPRWPGEGNPYLTAAAIALILMATAIIYGQTLRVPALDFEDYFYLVHSPYVAVNQAYSSLAKVWTEPYFANFHPVTTTTWLVDRALADKSQPFDAVPFRIAHLLYTAIGASLLIPLYRRLGIPAILAALGALLYAVHPIHTEVAAWLSARKDLISLIFILLSFLAWLRAREAATPGQWRVRHAAVILLVLVAILSKPIAVILPALFVAFEFCSAPHTGILRWRWSERDRQPILTRTVALASIFLAVAGISAAVFRNLLLRDALHGGWLIFVPVGLLPLMLPFPPSAQELKAVREGTAAGVRVLGPPLVILALLSGACSAWTFWAQGQVGAIKGGLTIVPTLNLTFDAMLRYAGKTILPLYMSASHTWAEFPYVSVNGLLGAALVCGMVWIGLRLAGSSERNERLISFGIFWYLIALVPVSNLVPTSTKMADRYLYVPTVGAILGILAFAGARFSASPRSQSAACGALLLAATGFTAWSYNRTEVWCGKTMQWKGLPQPDLSIWQSAVETDPANITALTALATAYLRLSPPEAGQALVHLNRALELGEASQGKIADDKRLDLTDIDRALGDAYLAQAAALPADKPGSKSWQARREAYANAVKYLETSSQAPTGFAPADARVFSRLSEACEGQAEMDAQELSAGPAESSGMRIRERDALRTQSEDALRRARDILIAGNIPPVDPIYRQVILGQGNILFGREVGAASNEEKAGYYRQALVRYQEAAALLPDDPQPFLYQGLCYERLTGIAPTAKEKQEEFALGEQALRQAIARNAARPDYSPAMPYRALASLYGHVNDFRSALDALKKARQADPANPEAAGVEREIQGLEQYLATQGKNP